MRQAVASDPGNSGPMPRVSPLLWTMAGTPQSTAELRGRRCDEGYCDAEVVWWLSAIVGSWWLLALVLACCVYRRRFARTRSNDHCPRMCPSPPLCPLPAFPVLLAVFPWLVGDPSWWSGFLCSSPVLPYSSRRVTKGSIPPGAQAMNRSVVRTDKIRK